MATLREHIHVYKIELSNYGKSYLLILLVHFTIVIVAALCLYRIEECGNHAEQETRNVYAKMVRAGYDICDLARTLNVTKDSEILKTNFLGICKEITEERTIVKDSLEIYNKSKAVDCHLDSKMFTKWFHFNHQVSRFLGHSPGISLSNGGQVFLAIYSILSLFVTIVTYVIGSMLINTTVKIAIAAMETYIFKQDAINTQNAKVIVATSVLSVVFWLILSVFKTNYQTNISFSKATYWTLSEILTIGLNSDVFGQEWMDAFENPSYYTVYILLYYVEMGTLLSLIKLIMSKVISKRSGVCCIARIYNQRQKYNVTCPKCVMVEKELEYVKRKRELRESVA